MLFQEHISQEIVCTSKEPNCPLCSPPGRGHFWLPALPVLWRTARAQLARRSGAEWAANASCKHASWPPYPRGRLMDHGQNENIPHVKSGDPLASECDVCGDDFNFKRRATRTIQSLSGAARTPSGHMSHAARVPRHRCWTAVALVNAFPPAPNRPSTTTPRFGRLPPLGRGQPRRRNGGVAGARQLAPSTQMRARPTGAVHGGGVIYFGRCEGANGGSPGTGGIVRDTLRNRRSSLGLGRKEVGAVGGHAWEDVDGPTSVSSQENRVQMQGLRANFWTSRRSPRAPATDLH